MILLHTHFVGISHFVGGLFAEEETLELQL
jgi:hypothetical protein